MRRILAAALLWLVIVVADVPAQRNGYALVIGIRGYPNFPDGKKLRFADRDARSFYDFITSPSGGGFRPQNVKLLLNEQATRQAIAEAKDWLENVAGTEDVAFIFFAGHGVKNRAGHSYLMAYDGNPRYPEVNGIRSVDFVRDLGSGVDSRILVFFFDACYSGGGLVSDSRSAGGDGVSDELQNLWAKEFARDDRIKMALMSAASNEQSWEDENLDGGHGVFTWYLLKGLKGEADGVNDDTRDGRVTAGEVYRYLYDRVSAHTRTTFRTSQTPTKSPDFTSNFPFSVVRAAATGVAPVTAYDNAARARELFSQAYKLANSGKHDEATQLYRQVIQLNPSDANAHNNLGVALSALGDTAGAALNYKQAIRLDQTDAIPLSNLAGIASDLGMPDSALVLYRRALRLEPTKARRHYDIGRVFVDTKKYREAIPLLKEAIRLDSAYASAYFNLGYAQGQLEQRVDAIAAYRKTIQLDPNHLGAHNNLGWQLSQTGDLVGAIRHYRTALRVKPDYALARRNLAGALKTRGVQSRDSKQFTDALRDLREAYELQPADTAIQNALADTHSQQGDTLRAQSRYADARAEYEKALEIRPSHMDAISNLMWITHEIEHDFERAYQISVSRRKSRPDDLGVRLDYIEAAMTSQRFSEARQELTTLLARSDVPPRLELVARAIQLAVFAASGANSELAAARVTLAQRMSALSVNSFNWTFSGTLYFVQGSPSANRHSWLVQLLQAMDRNDTAAAAASLR